MQNPNKPALRIAITTGDRDGVGSEVAAKALAELGPQPDVQFLWWRSKECPKADLDLIDSKFSRVEVPDSPEVWMAPFDPLKFLDVISIHSPSKWVWDVSKACLNDLCDAMVTGPLSKTGQEADGVQFLGHTGILAESSGVQDLFMSFIGREFGVVLATSHVPLSEVKRKLNKRSLTLAIDHALALRKLLPEEKRNLPVAVVGINPHAGEEGLIGKDEIVLLKPVVDEARTQKKSVVGPLVPDAAFLPSQRSKYSVFVAAYHDQGLIPFKLVHGHDQGVHITMGLPFVRTSVDHGTAKDIFGLRRAQSGSMFEAIQAAIQLSRTRRGQI